MRRVRDIEGDGAARSVLLGVHIDELVLMRNHHFVEIALQLEKPLEVQLEPSASCERETQSVVPVGERAGDAQHREEREPIPKMAAPSNDVAVVL